MMKIRANLKKSSMKFRFGVEVIWCRKAVFDTDLNLQEAALERTKTR